MSVTTNGRPLSTYLQGLLQAELISQDLAAELNVLPTAELQEQALERYRMERPLLMRRIVGDVSAKAPAGPRILTWKEIRANAIRHPFEAIASLCLWALFLSAVFWGAQKLYQWGQIFWSYTTALFH